MILYYADVSTQCLQGAAYPYHWGALRPAMSTSFLGLAYSNLIREQEESYAAQLFNYAQYQVCLITGLLTALRS